MISSIRLKNFKGFADQAVPLAPLSIFMGENGAGKSSVLQALLLVRQSIQSGDLLLGRITLNGDLCSIGVGADLLRVGADEEFIEILMKNDSGDVSTYAISYESEADSLPVTKADAHLNELTRGGFIYLSAERVGPRLTSPRSIAKAAQKFMGVNGEGALAVLETYRAHILSADDPRRRGQAGSLEEIFQSYLADISPNARVDLKAYSDVDSIGSTFSFSLSGGLPSLPFRPTNVGFGLSYSLAILVACLAAEAGSIIIVENPEAHLHTKSQRAVSDLLTRTAMSGVQVFVETHSREMFHWLRNQALRGTIPADVACVNYIEAKEKDGQRVSTCSSLRTLTDNLIAWPENFYDAYGSPTDLINALAL